MTPESRKIVTTFLAWNRLAHQNLRMAHPWAVDEIKVIYSKNPNVYYIFRVEDWLERNGLKNAVIKPLEPLSVESAGSSPSSRTLTLKASTISRPLTIKAPFLTNQDKVVYYISVITGNHRMAGTDARVFIEIHGTKGVTAQHRLHTSKSKREFHRNHMSHFHVSSYSFFFLWF